MHDLPFAVRKILQIVSKEKHVITDLKDIGSVRNIGLMSMGLMTANPMYVSDTGRTPWHGPFTTALLGESFDVAPSVISTAMMLSCYYSNSVNPKQLDVLLSGCPKMVRTSTLLNEYFDQTREYTVDVLTALTLVDIQQTAFILTMLESLVKTMGHASLAKAFPFTQFTAGMDLSNVHPVMVDVLEQLTELHKQLLVTKDAA
jgi:hypothetical protein